MTKMKKELGSDDHFYQMGITHEILDEPAMAERLRSDREQALVESQPVDGQEPGREYPERPPAETASIQADPHVEAALDEIDLMDD